MNKQIKHKESKWASAVNAFAERSKEIYCFISLYCYAGLV